MDINLDQDFPSRTTLNRNNDNDNAADSEYHNSNKSKSPDTSRSEYFETVK
jgi:hypothetical protein